jgi:hypothetical protein
MKRLLIRSTAALSQLFDIEIIDRPLLADAPPLDAIVCPKCNGCGDFMHYLTQKTLRCDRCGGAGLRPV